MADFETFYRSHARLVYSLALSRTGDRAAAEDMTQEASVRAWQSFGLVARLDAAAQRAWLLRTARNLAVDAWRRREVRRSSPLPIDPPGAAEEPELRLDVWQALSELDQDQRDLVVMRYLLDLNSTEIGRVLDLPPGTVRRRLSDARQLLAGRLTQWATGGVRE